MPFTKTGKDTYTSPSGRHFNSAQVKLFYANGGKFPGQKESEMSKGSGPKDASYAAGGPVIGKVSNFMKVPDEFRDPDEGDATADEDQKYAKSGEGSGTGFIKPPKAASKCLPPVKPRK